MVVIKLCMSDGAVLGVTLRASYRRKPEVDEGSGTTYHMATLRVLVIVTLKVGVNIFRNEHLDIHWYQRAYMILVPQMTCFMEINMVRMRSGCLSSTCDQNLELR